MHHFSWQAAHAPAALPERCVHLWHIELAASDATLAQAWPLLSADEVARAQRFVFERDRRRFVLAHAALRAILGRYLSCPPRQLSFASDSYGKPRLLNPTTLQFNLSHSHSTAIVGLAQSTPLGVDVEDVRPLDDLPALARATFAPEESQALLALPEPLHTRHFFMCWTRKEAFIKAIGTGLSHPLDQFVVSLAPDQPAAILTTRPDPHEAHMWTLQHFDCGPDVLGACALRGHGWQFVGWRWLWQMLD